MTDNQKRAHDLAIAILGKIEVENIAENGTVDFYKKYKELYEVAVSAFNRDFIDSE